MKQLLSILFSNKLTLIVLLLFAVAMGYATFMENDFGTATAHQMIYGAWWFELLMAILALNFIGNIYRYKLLRKEKVSILVFHLAFIVILVGAFVTRYFGQEGLTRIREGQETDHVISQERYFSINANNRTDIWEFNDELELGRFKQPDLNLRVAVGQSNFKVVVNRFVPDAVQQITSSNHEDEVVEIIASTGHGRNSFYLAKGGSLFLNGQELTFDNPKHNAINLSKEKGGYWIESQAELSYMVMSTQQTGILVKNNVDSLRLRALYRSHDLSFVITKIHEGAKLTYETTDDKDMAQNAADLLFITLEGPKNRKEIMLAALDGVANPVQTAKLDDIDFQLSYGPRLLKLPFILTLKDFQLERYPGSTSPSSYASELVVDEGSKAFPYRISMNNVLDYQGYRFFQASYDTDELGTVLSVSQDYWGTRITYLGYFLMGIGMILTFFGKRSRFYEVSKKLKGLRLEKTLTCFFLISGHAARIAGFGEWIRKPDCYSFYLTDHSRPR
ncbi:MAG: cytochrome c biogenesis protein ResB, partial [Bacteroidota bacterium]